MELDSGQILNERYRITRLIGQGGMGAVYCGHDPVLDRPIAIKQLLTDPIIGEQPLEQMREQFLREAKSLASLHHPNLPRVTDYFTHGPHQYLVMDYIEGQSLQDTLKANSPGLDEDQVLDWADQLLTALDYIHQRNLVHRDIKPANIRLTPDGRIFLVDFGLVKSYDAAHPKTMTLIHGLGTIEYASPEQFDPDSHTDQRSDLYSLGATLYHLLAGEAPSSVSKRISDPNSFLPLRVHNGNISPEVEHVILRAMELERARRFASAGDMREALRQARQAHRVDSSATVNLPVPSSRRAHPRRWVALASIPAILAGVAIISIANQSNTSGASDHPISTNTSTMTSSASSGTPTGTPTGTATPTASLTLTPTSTLVPIFSATPLTPTAPAAGNPGGTSKTQNTPSGNPPRGQPTPKPERTPPGQGNPNGNDNPPGHSGNSGSNKPKK